MRTIRLWTIAAGAAMLTAGLAGCQSAPSKVTGAQAALPADEGSPAFLDRLERQNSVSQNDAFRGVLFLLDNQDPHKTFEERAKALLGRNIVPAEWELDAIKPVTREQLAYMVCTACKVEGGVWHTLLGHTRRYCLQEMQYQGFIAAGLGNTEIRGSEFVAVIARADAYLRDGEIPQALLPR